MDFSFYVLLILACMVLLLAMWVCASASTTKWGPDLTLELPPHLLQEALFRNANTVQVKEYQREPIPVPSAPSELPSAPLLYNEQPMTKTSPPPLRTFNPSVMLKMDNAVRVLPPRFEAHCKVKPVYYKFATEEPA